MSSVKASPLRLAIAAIGRMPPADKASDNRSPCVIVKLLCVTDAVYTADRQPVVFFPRFSRALSVPHLSEDASPVGGSAKGNGIRDNHRGRQPLGSSPRPIRGARLQQGKVLPCFGRLLASPLLAVCLPVFLVLGCCCRCGSVRWCGCCSARECARQSSTHSALLIVASFVFVKGKTSATHP
jgi:hypothetical protein